jgi:cadmium resistance protein CadD (predicted permease)
LEDYLSHIILAITTFAFTNIDDLLILSIYYASPDIKIKQIIAGQYLGVIALVLVSLTGFFFGEIIQPKYLSWLGLVPVFIGMKGLYNLTKKKKPEEETSKPLDHVSINFIQVAVITFFNGGDNIGVYTPLFAVTPVHYIALYIFIFILMIGVWCVFGYYLSKHPLMKKIFERYGKIIMPFFLILLGLTLLFN